LPAIRQVQAYAPPRKGPIPLVKLVGRARGSRAFAASLEALLDTWPLHPAIPGSISQFTSGAGIVVLTVPALMLSFARIQSCFQAVGVELELRRLPHRPLPAKSLVIVPAASLSKLTEHAPQAALSIGDVVAVSVHPEARQSAAFGVEWDRCDPGVRLETSTARIGMARRGEPACRCSDAWSAEEGVVDVFLALVAEERDDVPQARVLPAGSGRRRGVRQNWGRRTSRTCGPGGASQGSPRRTSLRRAASLRTFSPLQSWPPSTGCRADGPEPPVPATFGGMNTQAGLLC
jgi:hypothetical protein